MTFAIWIKLEGKGDCAQLQGYAKGQEVVRKLRALTAIGKNVYAVSAEGFIMTVEV